MRVYLYSICFRSTLSTLQVTIEGASHMSEGLANGPLGLSQVNWMLFATAFLKNHENVKLLSLNP